MTTDSGSTLLRRGTWFLVTIALFVVGIVVSMRYDVQFGIERRGGFAFES